MRYREDGTTVSPLMFIPRERSKAVKDIRREMKSMSRSPKPNGQKCLFFAMLPAEIRRKIYSLSLVELPNSRRRGNWIVVDNYEDSPPWPALLDSVSLLHVCRRMYLEATEVLYSEKKFNVAIIEASMFFARIGRRNAGFIREVRMRVWPESGKRTLSNPAREHQPNIIRDWLSAVRFYCPNVRRVVIDLRTGILSQRHDESEVRRTIQVASVFDPMIAFLRCIYSVGDYYQLTGSLDIQAPYWLFGTRVYKNLRDQVFAISESDPWLPSTEVNSHPYWFNSPDLWHRTCPICRGLLFNEERSLNEAAPKISSVSLLDFQPPILRRIFSYIIEPNGGFWPFSSSTNYHMPSGTSRHPMDPVTKLTVGIGKCGTIATLKGWNWACTKPTNQCPSSSTYPISSDTWIKELFPGTQFRFLLPLGSTCQKMREEVSAYLNDPDVKNRISFAFRSPSSAIKFIERTRVMGDQDFGALSSRTIPEKCRTKLRIPITNVSIRLCPDSYESSSNPRIISRCIRHLRLALSFFLALDGLQGLEVVVHPNCVPFLYFLGRRLLGRLASLANPEATMTAIAAARAAHTAENSIVAQEGGNCFSIPRGLHLKLQTPFVKVDLSDIRVVSLPYLEVAGFERRDISWMLRQTINAPFGFDGLRWKKFDGVWEVESQGEHQLVRVDAKEGELEALTK